MTTQHALLGLMTETSLHAGAGSAAGTIDLPIQREAHTGWPCVYGSAVKGALRARAEDQKEDHLDLVFGPDTTRAHEHAGALTTGDARLLLLPVRSLTGYFRHVTCPAILYRLERDMKRLELKHDPLPLVLKQLDKKENQLLALTAGPAGLALFLEELRFKTTHTPELQALASWLAELLGCDQARLGERLVVVNDDWFCSLADNATPIAAHIRINNQRKTVDAGALWYEETLPPETGLYVALAANDGRGDKKELPAQAVLAAITEKLFGRKPYLQIGGNETLGMGWCRVKVTKGGAR